MRHLRAALSVHKCCRSGTLQRHTVVLDVDVDQPPCDTWCQKDLLALTNQLHRSTACCRGMISSCGCLDIMERASALDMRKSTRNKPCRTAFLQMVPLERRGYVKIGIKNRDI